jgi:hypothetical protein
MKDSMEEQKLVKLKRITRKQAETLDFEKGAKLTCESDVHFRKNGRYTNTYANSWYKLSTCPDKEFSTLIDVRDFLLL